MIDTHCHLTFPDYAGRVHTVLDEARAVGVTGAITVSTTSEDCFDALAIAQGHERVWCTAGVHPLYADRGQHNWENLRAVAREPECVAWGELGLDNHYDKPAKGVQRDVLEAQLTFIEKCRRDSEAPIDLPIVVHCRKAYPELIPIFQDTSLDPARFVFHCFTGAPEDMRLLLDFGAMVSITGVVTFKNAPEVREAVKLAPLDRIMVETDAPFLTPAPYRTVRPNEPKYAMTTAQFLADLRGEDWETFHEAINVNTKRFYGVQA